MFPSRSMTMPRRPVATALAALALTLAGCAAFQPKTPEQIVQERAEARWAALIKGNFERAWTYADTATRERTPQEKYKSLFGSAGAWKSASVYRVNCQAESCIVRMRLTTMNMVPTFAQAAPQLTTAFDEEWTREQGQWYYKSVMVNRLGGSVEIPSAPRAGGSMPVPAASSPAR